MTINDDEPAELHLRRIISQAPDGARITVAPGEHFGPFVFNRPIRLVGRDTGQAPPVLLAVRGPIVIVRSPKVFLENLELLVGDCDYRDIDPELVYETNCKPELGKNVHLKGRIEEMGMVNKSGGWNLPVIIDLGDLIEKNRFSMPVVISVPGPTKLKSQISNMTIEPEQMQAAGDHVVHIRFDQGYLMKGIMLAGQIILDSQGESKTVWVVGQVLPANEYSAKAQNFLCLSSQSGRRFYFSETMVLGEAQFRSEPAAGQLPADQVHFVRDKVNVWSIIQTATKATPTVINGQPLPFAHRRLLQGSEVIQAAGIKLKVEPKEKKSSLELAGEVNFGKFSVARASGGMLRVKNISRQNWEGQLRSTVNWIQAPNAKVVCPGGRSVDVPIQLTPEAGKLQDKNHINYGALILEDSQESWLINALLEVDISGPSLVVQPGVLSFGKVSNPSLASDLKVKLKNTGSLDWSGDISMATWLEADKTSLTIRAGNEESISVKLKQDLTGLNEGPNSESKAIIIKGQGVEEVISCTIDYSQPKAIISPEPKELAFGAVTDWRKAKIPLALKNKGDRDWRGKVANKEDWLELATTGGQLLDEIKVMAQDEVKLIVQLKESSWTLPPDKQKTAAALRIVGEEKIELIFPASMMIQKPKIEAEPDKLDFEITNDPASWANTFSVRNHGAVEWSGNVKSTVPWLVAETDQIKILPGKTERVKVSVDVRVAVRLYSAKPIGEPKKYGPYDAVVINESGNQIAQVFASILIKEKIDLSQIETRPPEITEKPIVEEPEKIPPGETLDFGQVWLATEQFPSRDVPIKNPMPWSQEGSAHALVPWVSVSPNQFTCPKQQESPVVITLNKEIQKLSPGQREEKAVIVKCGGQSYEYHIKVNLVEAEGEPTGSKNETQSPKQGEYIIDFGEISDWSSEKTCKYFHLKNDQDKPMDGKATTDVGLTWLKVEPEQFRIDPGGSIDLRVELTKEARIKPKRYNAENAIQIEYQGQKLSIRVAARILRAPVSISTGNLPSSLVNSEEEEKQSPIISENHAENSFVLDLSKDPDQTGHPGGTLDFGIITNRSGDHPSRSIILSNGSTKTIKGITSSEVRWLQVEPDQFECLPGQQLQLKISLADGAYNLKSRSSPYKADDAVCISTDERKFCLQARVMIQMNG